MHRNALFAVAVAFGLLHLANSILVLETTGTLTAASLSTLGLGVGVSTTTAAAATALAGVGALAAAGVILAAKAASSNGKRSVNSCFPVNNADLFITLAANSDKLGCGMRLVCELEATPDEALSHEERLILGIFGRSPAPVNFDQLNTPKAGFQYAAFVGAKASSISECAATFNQCPFDRATMIEAFQKSGTNGL
ncbi:uncharacterized protein LOC122247609 [Penaeus japonicus]|uniref:uncharacterized protein LOC122247609 n=1 Tax=Penaeus japonicus TaxID=27405 RepID=UPI001C712BC6|nr:uncharacterized protein LOC122247609 [Penaeus japonicus]